ncbi:hypothetical protein G4B88_012242 [Cannabis sativa]|uniref:RING-type domain-containing protein n=1 Tax=Cannabis sativa TaxID=3483 RepID=A0A7J6I4F1_CANSA|nr:hypothetical protein G4B88_012242 [Cannabis sativa]
MLLYRNDIALPVSFCFSLFTLKLTYADFCQFCGSYADCKFVVYRNDVKILLINFTSTSMEDKEEVCRVLFTVDVHYTGSIEHKQSSSAGPADQQPVCPVCLERLEQGMGGILTTICNHSFHCSCISNWTDSSCPVCRYCQQQPEKSICNVCQTSENLWMCVICGSVGCGRNTRKKNYTENDTLRTGETQDSPMNQISISIPSHIYTTRVWDYAGDNYVHRLIQSKTDGKLVELNAHCVDVNNRCGSYELGQSVDCGFSEALLNSRVEVIVNEYNDLRSELHRGSMLV